MTVRRFAEGTKVTVDSSRAEITGILAKHGVMKMGWTTNGLSDQLIFELQGGTYRLTMVKPDLTWAKKMYPNAYDWNAKVEGEWRRRWRANVLLLKAKLEFVESGDTTLDREMLPYRVLRGGKTVEETMLAGGLPMLTAGGQSS